MNIKHALFVLLIGVSLYFSSVLIRATMWEIETEEYVVKSLEDIARPWSASKFNDRASIWLREKSPLKPDEIARLAPIRWGSFSSIQSGPDCNIHTGFDSYSNEKHIYALCTMKVHFEKKTIKMDIRLIEEDKAWKINNFFVTE